MEQSSLSQWNASEFRFTLFCERQVFDETGGLWAAAFELAPDEMTERRNAGERVEVGERSAGVTVELRTSVNRLDLFMRPSALPSLDDPLPILGTFDENVARWLDACSRVVGKIGFGAIRVAYALKLHHAPEERTSAYVRLKAAMPVAHFDENAVSDFLLQLNFPTVSTVRADMRINRFSKWAALKVLLSRQGRATPVDDSCFASVELDLSTDADWMQDAFDGDLILKFFEEMHGEVSRVVAKGGACLVN